MPFHADSCSSWFLYSQHLLMCLSYTLTSSEFWTLYSVCRSRLFSFFLRTSAYLPLCHISISSTELGYFTFPYYPIKRWNSQLLKNIYSLFDVLISWTIQWCNFEACLYLCNRIFECPFFLNHECPESVHIYGRF